MAGTTEQNEKDVRTVINVAAAGDVILIVGPERLKLRVQSLVLKSVSKPFSAMLSQRWTRHEHATDELSELLLSDDDAVGMKYMRMVVHHQNKMMPEVLAAHDILKVAVMADKYDLVNAFVFTSTAWLSPNEKMAEELMVLVAATLLFQNKQAFKAVTKTLILEYGGSYLTLVDQDLESIMNWRIVCE